MQVQTREQRLVSPLNLLVLFALVLSLLQKSSPEITPLEIVVSGILAIICIWGIVNLFTIRVKLPKTLFYLFVFALWAALNIILAIGKKAELETWFRYFFPAFLLPMISLVSFIRFKSWKSIRSVYIILIFMGVSVVAADLLRMHSVNLSEIAGLQMLRRYAGGYFSPFTLCLRLPLLLQRPRSLSLQRLCLWLALAISLVGLILTFTRTYWISVAVSLLFMMYLLGKTRRQSYIQLLWRVVLVSGLGIAVLIGVAPEKAPFFVESRAGSVLDLKAFSSLSFQERAYEAKGLFHAMLRSPISFGIGNSFGAKFTYYSVNPFDMGGVGWRSKSYSHNYYLYLLFTTGAVGLSLFLIAWVSLFLSIRRFLMRLKEIPEVSGYQYLLIGTAAAIVNLLIASLTAPPLMSFKWDVYFGLLVGLALNLVRLPQRVDQLSDRKCRTKEVS